MKRILKIALLILLIVGVYQTWKPLPQGLSLEGDIHPLPSEEVEFLYDLTYNSASGERVVRQEIFDLWLEMVEEAEKFILIDVFLFNNDYGVTDDHLPLTDMLREALIAKKVENPDIKIIFITDPINNFYGSYRSKELMALEEAGIEVVITDLSALRDSNPYYSSLWRTFFQWFKTEGDGWVAHPLNSKDKKVTIRSYLSLFNTKANHRKVIMADNRDEVWTLIASANPHTASSLHSNIAFLVKGGIWQDVWQSEKAVLDFSGASFSQEENSLASSSSKNGEVFVNLLTEGAIRKSLIEDISSLEKGDSLAMAMFYLSDRKIIKEIKKAYQRGVLVRILLDPNKDAFGREKSGIPNRQVAYELEKEGISVRWFDTQGEQFHAKMTIMEKGDHLIVNGGSANLTRRNIGDFNLETNVRISTDLTGSLSVEIREYFDLLWGNIGAPYSLDFEAFKDSSKFKYWLYRFQEKSGFSSF